MTLKNKIKKYTLPIMVSVAFISGPKTIIDNSLEESKLENSNYILRCKDPCLSLYGFDDNSDSKIDRIERTGLVPFKTGLPAFRIRETYLPSDSNYSFYYNRIISLGKPKL